MVGDHGRTLRDQPGQAQRDEIPLRLAESMLRIRYGHAVPWVAGVGEVAEDAGENAHVALSAGILVLEMLWLIGPALPTFPASHLHPPGELKFLFELAPAVLPVFAASTP